MGADSIRTEIKGPCVGGKLGEMSATIGDRLSQPKRNSLVQVLGASLIDFANPDVSLFKIENWKNRQ